MQQNGISQYDRMCPFYKTVGMLKNFVNYHDACARVVETTDMTYAKVSRGRRNHRRRELTLAQIRDATSDVVYKLSQMKFEDPNTSSEQEIQGKLDALSKEIEETFRRINE